MIEAPTLDTDCSTNADKTLSFGVFVISLDFELQWGVRDLVPLNTRQKARLLSARRVIPRILDLFEEFSIHATWATVGLLLAHTREEVQQFLPRLMPGYNDRTLNPYSEHLGSNEDEDPFHFAPSLVAEISKRPGQEIGSHSFSHYYCLEPGQTPEEFESDLKSAISIMRKSGYETESFVFPRNEVNESYIPILEHAGVACYRSTETAPSKRARPFSLHRRWPDRLARLTDCYVDLYGSQTSQMLTSPHPVVLPASRYLRPYCGPLSLLESFRISRIDEAMKYAAEKRRVFHLWWHPEDFAADPEQNLQFLRAVLSRYNYCRERFAMATLSMREVAKMASSNAAPIKECLS